VGLFGKIFKKKDEFLGDVPPDFSQPLGQAGRPAQDPFAQDVYGKDPLQGGSPFDSYAQGGQLGGAPPPDSSFGHDIFSSAQPTNADRARDYAQQLGGQNPSPGLQSTTTYGGAITGHEAQLILERLDTVKAELDAIKQRLMHVERYMESAEQKAGQRKYF
jgi:hypothetical protein